MKKVLALLLAFVLAFAFVGCGGDNDGTADTSGSEGTTEASTADTSGSEDTTEASTADTSGSEDTTEASTADTDVKSEGVMTYAEYAAAALDSQVIVETYVQAKQGWWEEDGVGKATFYTQDKDGAYFIYNMPITQEEYDKLTTGTKIKVTGYKTEWSGEVEIIDATYEILEGSYVAEALDATALLGTDDLINHQNMFVSFKGMTVEASTDADGNAVAFLYGWDGSGQDGSDLYFNVSVNGQTYNFLVESYLTGAGTEVYEAVKGLQIGDVIDLEGFLYWYEGVNPHITSVTKAQ